MQTIDELVETCRAEYRERDLDPIRAVVDEVCAILDARDAVADHEDVCADYHGGW